MFAKLLKAFHQKENVANYVLRGAGRRMQSGAAATPPSRHHGWRRTPHGTGVTRTQRHPSVSLSRLPSSQPEPAQFWKAPGVAACGCTAEMAEGGRVAQTAEVRSSA
jgi:hypothetical protein